MRTIKPQFFANEALGELSRDGRLLFIGLWMMADKNGCLKNNTKKIKVEVFPYDEDMHSALLIKLLHELHEATLIKFYSVTEVDEEDGTVKTLECICIKTFLKHQKLTSWEENKSFLNCPPPPYIQALRDAAKVTSEDSGSDSAQESTGEKRTEDTHVGESEGEVTSLTYGSAFKALRETGKVDQLMYEHVQKVAQEFPLAQIDDPEQYGQLVLELKGVAGKVSAALPWLRKATSRLEVRTVGAMKKETAAETPRDREFVGGAHE